MAIKIETPTLSGVLLALSLLLNPWVVGKVLAPDGRFEDTGFLLNIVLLELTLLFSGLLLLRGTNLLRYLLRYLVGGAISGLLILSFYNASRLAGHQKVRQPVEETAGTRPRTDHQLLRDVLSLDGRDFATLDLESSEILHTLHQPVESLRRDVPAGGILDTALGVHPGILDIFLGKIRFDVRAREDGSAWETIFRKAYSLSDTDMSRWDEVTVDLSKYEGRSIEIQFLKSHETKTSAKLREVYDLGPTDFMFWRKPRVRPLRLPGQKNVILISLDTLRADHLSFMGYPRQTSPTLDRLARNGVAFTQCISQAPWTTPSHFSMLTGTYPTIHGGDRPFQEKRRWWNDHLPTMADILDTHGYTTGAFTGRGSISAEFGFYKGFDFYNESERDANGSDIYTIVNKAIEWLRSNKTRTFFLFVHTYEPHGPFSDDYFVLKERISTEDVLGHKIARYDGDIRHTDFYIGKLVAAMEELSLLDKTILVITSDHGEDLFEREIARPVNLNPLRGAKDYDHGHSLYDDLLRVPLIYHGLGPEARQNRVESQVRSIDILPTIIDYLDLRPMAGIQGESLRRHIEGAREEDLPAFSEATSYGTRRESVRTGDFKYIRRISYGELIYDSSAGFPLTPVHELYNLTVDHGETRNIAAAEPGKLKELQELLQILLPSRALSDDEAPRELKLDFQEDPELIEELRSLGYVD